MKLGAFSISLAVKDLSVSKAFYEKLGFTQFAGDFDKKYMIMKNEDSLIGLFEGMFENNILTFNPGWDQSANTLENYDDVRKIQSELQSKAVALDRTIEASSTGPGSIVLTDPDGNHILIDQHI